MNYSKSVKVFAYRSLALYFEYKRGIIITIVMDTISLIMEMIISIGTGIKD
jgi:hypothetical protein